MSRITFLLTSTAFAFLATTSGAQPPAEQQIAAAVLAAPEDQRDGATVLGRRAGTDGLVELRSGDGALVCLADDPSDDRFHVACYHRDLEAFMARGRQLRAEGKERAEILEIRGSEIEAGTLPYPDGPRALYSLTGPADAWDPESGTAEGASPVWVVYVPGATAESTGLSPSPPAPGAPWIMSEGTPWAHVMIVPPRPESDESEESGGDGEPDGDDSDDASDDR